MRCIDCVFCLAWIKIPLTQNRQLIIWPLLRFWGGRIPCCCKASDRYSLLTNSGLDAGTVGGGVTYRYPKGGRLWATPT